LDFPGCEDRRLDATTWRWPAPNHPRSRFHLVRRTEILSQYIIKNLVLIAAALVVGGTVRGRSEKV
jgi:hypothetical protein